jgi:type IV pilus assembly protein PilY1
MHYYETDLSAGPSGLPDNVHPIPSVDENEQQHLVTFSLTFGVNGTLENDPPNRTDPFPWPPVCPRELTTVDDMRHAAWNGRGAFLSARNPAEVSTRLERAIASIAGRTAATGSPVGFNATDGSTNALLFQTRFSTSDWSGDLLAFGVQDADTSPTDRLLWSAAERLEGTDPGERVILTRGARSGLDQTDCFPDGGGNGGDTTVGGVAFEWQHLTCAQRRDLSSSASGDTDEPYSAPIGQRRLDYLRGERECEAPAGCTIDPAGEQSINKLTLRARGSVLGDIVGSGPIFVGPPALNWPSSGSTFFPSDSETGETYSEFKNGEVKDRTPVVYVGANDGMLHGFRASDGKELLAYIPSNLFSSVAGEGLHHLTTLGYAGSHRYYVDRTPSISDVFLRQPDLSWRTIAVGGQGAGGRGLYALDITDPGDFTASNADEILLWEFTDADDEELGFTLSQPVIGMMNNGTWAAVVGSGYNDTGAEQAHLFVFFLQEGVDGAWEDGDYVRIEADVASLAERNGLSSPAAADLDGNGTIDRVYAGDLLGNLWVFDLSQSLTDDWEADILFTARSDAGVPQPITTQPEISKHPALGDTDDNEPNVMVYFGTGQYLTEGDIADSDEQSFYGVWHHGRLGLDRSDLQEQELDDDFAGDQVLTDAPVDWSSQHGWYIDLPVAGERVVVDAILRGDIVFFNSLVPETATKCEGGGSGFLYAVDMDNGGRPGSPPFDVDGDGKVDERDLIEATGTESDEPPVRAAASRQAFGDSAMPTASTFVGSTQYTGDSEGGGLQARAVVPLQTLETGRISWEQLVRP